MAPVLRIPVSRGPIHHYANESELVCAACRVPWEGNGAPGGCPACGKHAYPVVREVVKVK